MNVLTIGGAMVDTIVTIASDKIEQIKMRNAESSFLLLEEGQKTEAEQIAMGQEMAKDSKTTFDPKTVKGPKVSVQIKGEGAEIK